jgi:hypothetical protein
MPDHAPSLASLQEALRGPPRPFAQWRGLLAVFAVLAWVSAGPLGVVTAAALLALGALLRLAAMKLLGAEDVELLVLPLTRGAFPPETPAWKEAVLVLVQPAFLLALFEATFQLWQASGGNLTAGVARMAWVGALLLLPLQPLDGWRLLDLGVASRVRVLEPVVSGVFAVLLTLAGASTNEPVLMGLGAFLGVATVNLLKLSRAAEALRAAGVPLGAPVGALPPATLAALRQAVEAHLGPSLARWRARPAETALRVEAHLLAEVYRRAARRPTAPGLVVALTLAWLGLGGAFGHALWRLAALKSGTAA